MKPSAGSQNPSPGGDTDCDEICRVVRRRKSDRKGWPWVRSDGVWGELEKAGCRLHRFILSASNWHQCSRRSNGQFNSSFSKSFGLLISGQAYLRKTHLFSAQGTTWQGLDSNSEMYSPWDWFSDGRNEEIGAGREDKVHRIVRGFSRYHQTSACSSPHHCNPVGVVSVDTRRRRPNNSTMQVCQLSR